MNSKEKSVSENGNSRQKSVNVYIAFYILIALVFVAIGPMVFSSDWVSSSDFHSSIEITSEGYTGRPV